MLIRSGSLPGRATPAAGSRPVVDVAARALKLLQTGEIFCLATVLPTSGKQRAEFCKALVRGNGAVEGSLGSREVDRELGPAAEEAMMRRRSGVVELAGGTRVFLDVLAGEAELLICGAGHIAIPLARFARALGFAVTVLDDREDFAHPDRFPDCRLVAEDFVTALRVMPLGPSTYVVVITRGHEHDAECLEEVLPKPTAYVGLIGSRRRVRFVKEMLRDRGHDTARVDEVFTPIGVPLGADSPAEIALSIAAELLCVHRKGPEQARRLRGLAEAPS